MLSHLARAWIVFKKRHSMQYCFAAASCFAPLLLFLTCITEVNGADVSSVWNGSNGSWGDVARWSSNPLVPNNGNGGFTYDATIAGGSVFQNQNATIENLFMSGGDIRGPAGGSITLNLSGLLSSWSGGTIARDGRINVLPGATLNLQGVTDKYFTHGWLQIGGIATWSNFGHIIATSPGAKITTLAGGVFDVQNDATIYSFGIDSSGDFVNSGTLRKSAGTETLIIGNWTFTSTGTIDIQTGSLRLANSGGSTISGQITIANDAGLSFVSGVHNLTGASITNNGLMNIYSSVTINSTNPIAGDGITIVNLGGNLAATNLRMNSLEVDGAAIVSVNGTNAGASKVESLIIGPTGKLNLKDNDLVIGTGSKSVIRNAIKTGTTAAQLGILSDAAGVGITRGFGYAAGNDPNLSPPLLATHLFAGQTFDNDSVLVKYTFLGDADLDGDSDLNDLGLWASSFTGDLGNPLNPVTFWTSGDFDYDGDTDLNDLGLWSSTFTGDLGGTGTLTVNAPRAPSEAVAVLNGMGITVIPEPSSVAVIFACGLGVVLSLRIRETKASLEHK